MMPNYVSMGAVQSGIYRYRLWRRWEIGLWDDEVELDQEITFGPDSRVAAENLAAAVARTGNVVTFVMLNPSTAGMHEDDPTIRRCVGFAQRWGARELQVVNLIPYRATDPAELSRLSQDLADGDVLQQHIAFAQALRVSDVVVCAWGSSGPPALMKPGIARLRGKLEYFSACRILALGTTLSGDPRHPLYVRTDTVPSPFDLGVGRAKP